MFTKSNGALAFSLISSITKRSVNRRIGFYPVPGAIDQVDSDFASYKTSGKGTIQFPLNMPMPLNLITKLAKFKVKVNIEKAAKKKKQKKITEPLTIAMPNGGRKC
jgi:uncharacterized protein YdhG (YjbR/CyaY superfamily)